MFNFQPQLPLRREDTGRLKGVLRLFAAMLVAGILGLKLTSGH